MNWVACGWEQVEPNVIVVLMLVFDACTVSMVVLVPNDKLWCIILSALVLRLIMLVKQRLVCTIDPLNTDIRWRNARIAGLIDAIVV